MKLWFPEIAKIGFPFCLANPKLGATVIGPCMSLAGEGFEIMTMRRLFAVVLLPWLLSVAFLPTAKAADLAAAQTVVQKISDEGIHQILAADIPQSERVTRFQTLFDAYFDVPGLAHFVLGRAWKSADPGQLDKFVVVFRDITIYSWARRFKTYSGQEIKVVSASADGDSGAFVDSQIDQPNGQKPIAVRWRLRVRPESKLGWQVVDLNVEGVSLAITQRSDYDSFLSQNNNDLNKLIDKLTAQAAALKATSSQ